MWMMVEECLLCCVGCSGIGMVGLVVGVVRLYASFIVPGFEK